MSYPDNEKWISHFQLYKQYVTTHNKFPGINVVSNGVRIGHWLKNQVVAYRTGTLSEERIMMLDGFNPAWRGGSRERRGAVKQMLVDSDWKNMLKPGDIPIDDVLSDEALASCIKLNVLSCRAYLDYFVSHVNQDLWSSCFGPRYTHDAFAFTQREQVFHAQFPNIDFRYFKLYLDVLDVLPTQPLHGSSPVEQAAAYSIDCPFTSRKEMADKFEEVIGSLNFAQEDAIFKRYKERMTFDEMSNISHRTCERMRQVVMKGLFTLRRPANFQHIASFSLREKLMANDAVRSSSVQNASALSDKTKGPDANLPEKMAITSLNISKRAFNCLKHAGIETTGDLIRYTEEDLLKFPNMGVGTVENIRNALASHGLALSSPNSDSQLQQPSQMAKKASLDSIIQGAASRQISAPKHSDEPEFSH